MIRSPLTAAVLVLAMVLITGTGFAAQETFSFDVEEFEKKRFEYSGYLELKGEQLYTNETGTLARINPEQSSRSTRERVTGTVQLAGSYDFDLAVFNWLLTAAGQQSNDDWLDTADAYEAYLRLEPLDNTAVAIGKKAYKWGTGYAWNPVGFINRPKDPTDPDESREGFITLESELIRSFSGNLRNGALTVALLPVVDEVNEDFGQPDALNLAARLYLLYRDTDIDLTALVGDSRSSRFGLDFSRNLTSNFEFHGEAAYVHDSRRPLLGADGSRRQLAGSSFSWLFGLRYLSAFDLTTIVEYYHNGPGYSEDELSRFYQLLDRADSHPDRTAAEALFQQAESLALQGYARPFLGRDYLYARFSLKEPFDILYFTPALTVIVNLGDGSFSATPEIVYTGLTNWELRLRAALFGGGNDSEYGEKLNDGRLELRLRYYF